MIDQKNLEYFNKLYNDTYEKTFKYVIYNCFNISDVNDIIQDVYLELYKIIQRKGCIEFDNSYAFVIGIAKNKIKKYYKLKYKMQNISLFSKKGDIELQDIVVSDARVEEIIINTDNIQKIWKFLRRKKGIIGKIFYLYYYMDLTIKEISVELNINESGIKNYLYRTLKEMNKKFHMKGDKDV